LKAAWAGNNLSKIMDNVNAIAKNGGPAPTNTATKAASQPGRKIEVDDFLIPAAVVHVSFTGIGGREMTLPLPDIHLNRPGQSSAGIHGDRSDAGACLAPSTARHHQDRRQRHH